MIERMQLPDERIFVDFFNSDYNDARQRYVKYRIVAVRKDAVDETWRVRGVTPVVALRVTYAKGKLIFDNYDVAPGTQYSADEIAWPLTDEAARFVASNHARGCLQAGADWGMADGHAAPRDQVAAYQRFWLTYLDEMARLVPKVRIIAQFGSLRHEERIKLMAQAKCAGFYYQYLMGDQPTVLDEHEMWWNRAWEMMSLHRDRLFVLGVKLDELRTVREFPYERLLAEFLNHRGPKHYLHFDLDRSKLPEGWNPILPAEAEAIVKRMRRP